MLRLDDGFPDHPKISNLSDGAFRLHVAGLCYAARYRTDGLVPQAIIASLVRPYRRAVLSELTDRLLWVDLGEAAAYEIHDYLDWNMSRDKLDQLSRAGREAARRRWERS